VREDLMVDAGTSFLTRFWDFVRNDRIVYKSKVNILCTVHKLLFFVISRNEIVSIPLVGKSLFLAIMRKKLFNSHAMNMKGIPTG
jgi:hypothetical protein